MLTQERLKELLHYDPSTGIFTRLAVPKYCHNACVGDVAGYVMPEGYVRIKIDSIAYKAHRLAFFYMTGEMPEYEVDHINGIKGDNRFCNLRVVSRNENMRNKGMHKNNTSGVMGVNWNKNLNKWHARIMHFGKSLHLGFYDDLELASFVVSEAREKYGFHENHGRLI
jgi:hypothetical protein